MGAGASSEPPFPSAEEALSAGKTQEEIDAWITANNPPESPRAAGGAPPPAGDEAAAPAVGTGLTLVYLKMQALAEAPQMMLRYAGIPYDYEYAFNYWSRPWGQCKALVPFGQAPVLIVGGDEANMIAQSGSICRYIASLKPELFKPADLVQCARCDAIFDSAQELFPATNPVANFFSGDRFAGAVAKFMETWPTKLAQFARQLELSSGPFFFGEAPKYCDFAVYHHFMTIRLLQADALDAAPSVVAFMAAFEGLDNVKEYLASRPSLVGVGEKPMLRFPDGREMPPGVQPEEVSTALSKVKSSVPPPVTE